LQEICYACGREVASEFVYLNQGKEEFNMQIAEPVLSTKPILKKYEHALLMGTLPTGKKLSNLSPEQIEEKKTLIYRNNRLFAEIKDKLISMGFNNVSIRANVFARFNANFYEMDINKTHTLEITKIILADKAEDYISTDELRLNIEKLAIMKNCLDRMPYNSSFEQFFKILEKSGKNARHIIIEKYKTLPELYSGFYHTYIDADRKIAQNKIVKEQTQKQKLN